MHIVNRGSTYNTVRGTIAFHYNALHLRGMARVKATLGSQASLQKTVDEFNAKRVVLTVTAGRTGTDSLNHLFRHLPDTHASHEPNPNHRFILARVQHDPVLAARFFWYLQAPSIVSRAGSHVVESSHLFCKGFFEPCIAAGFRPALVMLQRDTRTTALSHQRKHAVPGRTGAGHRYLIAPTDRPYLKVDAPESLTDYQLCYWYCLEIELRQKLYSEIASELGMPIFTMQTKQLSDVEKLVEACVALGLADAGNARQALEKAGVGTAHNATTAQSKSRELNFDPAAEEDALHARLQEPAGLDEVRRRIEEAKRLI
ncbi:hypothetical protein [Shimia ponticola]|uniref:hypothetical protein n=1 Tax=Shimia ponticola TaxID=2582893 RepID=UPI0011BFE262|nr:hypothetical protein [Shimia ponticola]